MSVLGLEIQNYGKLTTFGLSGYNLNYYRKLYGYGRKIPEVGRLKNEYILKTRKTIRTKQVQHRYMSKFSIKSPLKCFTYSPTSSTYGVF
jgi:hypothetical protein